jgi:hypothetical protein
MFAAILTKNLHFIDETEGAAFPAFRFGNLLPDPCCHKMFLEYRCGKPSQKPIFQTELYIWMGDRMASGECTAS